MAGGYLLIGAPSSGSGKTTVTLALMALLTSQGKKVQGFKWGRTTLIQPSIISLRADCHTIWMCGWATRRMFDRRIFGIAAMPT